MPARSFLEDFAKRNWFNSPPRNAGRSLDIVRVAVALILIVHPLYAFLHPDVLLIACFFSVLLAYWPRKDSGSTFHSQESIG
jgi:hypothetical protein